MRYTVVIEKADGNYSVPDLPGCVATTNPVSIAPVKFEWCAERLSETFMR
ncbi:MAG: type II toxin-antitoxin system HicB family antitoxin [Bradyrhizobium sp.]